MKNQTQYPEITSKALREAMHSHALEGNPMDSDDIAMFAMFEREGWDSDRRRAYIIAQCKSGLARTDAAE